MSNRIRFEPSALLLAAAALFLLIEFGLALIAYGQHAAAALNFPYPLDYNEGPILDQVMRLTRGESLYRADLSTPPYTMTNTPPLFQLIQFPFAKLFGPAFWYGRALSILGAVLAALFIGLIIQTLTRDWLAACISGLLLFTFPFILQVSALDRVESVGLALSLAGLFMVVRLSGRAAILAAVLFTAAAYTRPSYLLVGPLTALLWLFQTGQARRALKLAGLIALLCTVCFVLLNWLTGGGFAFNVINGFLDEVAAPNILDNGIRILISAGYLALASGIFLILEPLGDRTRSWPLVMPYALLSLVVMAFTGRGGSMLYNIFEPAAALSLAAGALVAWPSKDARIRAGLVILIGLQVGGLISKSNDEYAPFVIEKTKSIQDVSHMAQLVRASNGPVLADEYMGLAPLVGKALYFQPYEMLRLQQAGSWDPGALIAAIQRHEFGVILIYFPRDAGGTILGRWPKAVYDAIGDNYRVVAQQSEVLIFMPR